MIMTTEMLPPKRNWLIRSVQNIGESQNLMVFLYSKVSVKERAELKDPPAKGSVLYTKTGLDLCILDCSPFIKTITKFHLENEFIKA